ncbi:carboxylesterase/lipase family protein [Microbacterium sp. SORGH_AS_0862]|uniref:carboxylesterase/lipase family protein n=1 Tax=Microbacterium sp. SORGH_AS_0862 TaxID=3041789 RepID=UPI00278DDE93|nr:carboxylesterase family protein [Microbacterium sp. SORGH_AS_0862]MDQ1203681.1 para-nitrobenzyl esterase [Microbacterium sp. SORGH_AS_0862]
MSHPVVHTEAGAVSGTRFEGIERYLRIPYAQPPVGARRFALPEPVAAWEGVREATAFGPTSPQSPYPGFVGELLASTIIPGDDILTVNVWRPADADGAAVMLWVHGGALERGTSAISTYDGTPFARDGVVFVSANYRLGAEGFSVLPDAPRNVGLADAAEALRWTHRNIARFGGDPSRITIFGESAGGAVVAALLAREDLRPLLAGAVIESGPLDAVSAERAARPTQDIARKLGTPATAEALRTISPERLVAARDELTASSTLLKAAPGFNATIDPTTLPENPRRALVDADLPVIIGTNTDEYRLWYPAAALAKLSRRTYALLALAKRLPRGVWREYRAAFRDASPGEIIGQVLTDLAVRQPAIEVARARSAPTFVYEFAWPSPVRDLRAAHALEIGFVFDALGDSGAITMAGTGAPQELATRMHADWIRFAETGDPGWPAFRDGQLVRRYDTSTEDVPLPRAEVLAALTR